jgi:hypothetical protein
MFCKVDASNFIFTDERKHIFFSPRVTKISDSSSLPCLLDFEAHIPCNMSHCLKPKDIAAIQKEECKRQEHKGEKSIQYCK